MKKQKLKNPHKRAIIKQISEEDFKALADMPYNYFIERAVFEHRTNNIVAFVESIESSEGNYDVYYKIEWELEWW